MAHFFISYAREDKRLMQQLAGVLRDEGLDVWTDENLKMGTPSWQLAIQKAIESASGVLVLLSPDSKTSDWVAKELSYATIHNVQIFPVLVRGTVVEAIPISLINYHFIDATERSGKRLGKALVEEIVQTLQEFFIASEDDKPQKVASRDLNDTARKNLEFWESLLQASRERSFDLFAHVSPKPRPWLSASAGKSFVFFNYIIRSDLSRIELYIDHDRDTGAKNKIIFDKLYAQKEEIEKVFGSSLEWRRLEDNRASKIEKNYDSGGLNSPERWPEIQREMIEGMIKLHLALGTRIREMKI